jgi:hypothetical protein
MRYCAHQGANPTSILIPQEKVAYTAIPTFLMTPVWVGA